MVLAVGSMLVRGVYKGGELLTGLAKTVTGFKQTGKEGKSTETEMKRMSSTAKKLGGALALIGVGGFTALMMTAPQLSAALFRIKMQVRMIAWAIGRHLKPLLDAVGKILKAIRTGDWSMLWNGIKDAWNAIKGLVNTAWDWLKRVYNSLWDELGKKGIKKPGWIIWIENWILELERIIKEKDWNSLWDWAISPLKVVWDLFMATKVGGMVKSLLDEIVKEEATFISIGTFIWKGIWKGITDGIANSTIGKALGFGADHEHFKDVGGSHGWGDVAGVTETMNWAKGDLAVPPKYKPLSEDRKSPTNIEKQEIMLNFAGAHFDLAGGEAEIQSFAERIATYIAATQQDVKY